MLRTKIKYPDTLVAMWKYTHGDRDLLSDNAFLENYEILKKELTKSFKRKLQYTSGIDIEDIAKDFLIELLKKDSVYPSFITSSAILFAQAAKFAAKKHNPAQYELTSILYNALRTLEKKGKIKRDKASEYHNISASTLFALPDIPENRKDIENWENYKSVQTTIPYYPPKIRKNNPEKSRIITPKDALQLVESLIKAFDGWVNVKSLHNAMKNHVQEQFTTVPYDGKDFGKEDDITEYQKEQMKYIIESTRNKIWTRIRSVSDKVFCLYFIPSYYYDKKVSMKDIGRTSTVSDQNKKIETIVKEEMGNYLDQERKILKFCVENIFHNLNKMCTGIGYNMNLCNN